MYFRYWGNCYLNDSMTIRKGFNMPLLRSFDLLVFGHYYKHIIPAGILAGHLGMVCRAEDIRVYRSFENLWFSNSVRSEMFIVKT